MTTVTDAFQALLKTLCLTEFPCGNGSWRKQPTTKIVPMNYGKKVMKLVDKIEPQFSVTLQDYDASKTHIETLQEFVSTKHSPWTFDYSWSGEAKSLREIAVKSPELISDDFIHSHFVTLRLTDKGISDVDEQLLKFSNLEYITLSANYIRNVNSKNLPRKLLSLELNSNEVSELFSLCVDPPSLVHLGLGSNCLAYVDDYLSGDHWPALLSLDLSYNNLTDLPETLRKLKTLPNLRNLILMGNPLMLTPGYRGFVIDNLKHIDLLDDTRIEADERHRFNAMSKLTENELTQCQITFQVDHIRNAPKPLELQNPEEQPEFPIITRNYYVEFHYIDESSLGAEVFEMNFDSGFNFGQFGAPGGGMSGVSGGSPMPSERDDFQSPHSAPMSEIHSEKPPQPADTFFTDFQESVGNAPQASKLKAKSNILRTDKGQWATDIELNWSLPTTRDDLLSVRDFLKKPMKVEVIEETILSYPKEEAESEKSSSAKKKKEAEPKKDDKKGKKKKEVDQDTMRHEPPELNVLASFDISLEHFLSGEETYSETLTKAGMLSRAPSGMSHPSLANTSKKDKSRVKSADKKAAAKGKDALAAPAAEGRKKSGKKEGKKKEPEVELDPTEPPPPMDVNVTVTILRWKSTAETERREE